MSTMSVRLRTLPQTQATIGHAGAHTVVVDRPAGKAGGQGLGFNGGELLALAIGGCLCNDLHYVAHGMGIALSSVAVDVDLTFDGSPGLATAAIVKVQATATDPHADTGELIRRAVETSTVSNSLQRGFPIRTGVSIETGSKDDTNPAETHFLN
ncbi:Organic hydroperoxide reductase OsmC/OhrA [Devosia crocina]|uniref:Organic hydroperoxide reductase OsmC/OhrA n=1 Tax=Devosia crocina TaxID=429728 RepID=A0A1I7NNB7_9HYPH|nr:OsmC family protein [Devosia crocina]SFV36163.1 Organic hydroperoxide reductase OsmC/OhrA [Devosia crocina]